MGSGQSRPEEVEAHRILAQVLGVEVQDNDLPGRTSAYDFTLDPTGDPQALEVVRHADRERVKSMRAWERYAVPQGLRVTGLSRRWWLMVLAPASPKFSRLAKALQQPLQAAEAAGCEFLQQQQRWSSRDPLVVAAASGLAELGVEQAHSLPARHPEEAGQVDIGMGAGGSTGQGWQAALGELEAFLTGPTTADVRHKLAISGLARRHAFVRVDTHSPLPAWWLFSDETYQLPGRPPHLPPEITDVWWWTGHRGWRWSPKIGWSDLDPFPGGTPAPASR